MISSLLPSLLLLALGARASEVDINGRASDAACSLDQTVAPGNLTHCPDGSLFATWRPKARFIAPEGWLNDPMALWQRSDGSFHAGYQFNPQHTQWGNISMGAAHSKDFTHWTDFGSWDNAKTIWPSQVYDIRGVFDGTVFQNGFNGYPTILYTSTYTTALGVGVSRYPDLKPTYTMDEGASWIKLNFGEGGNPVIYEWPMTNLTGFRDPYVFLSPRLSTLLKGSASPTNATGEHFLTISSGVDGAGGKLLLYRQTKTGDVTGWTFLGPFFETALTESWSSYSGNFGVNYETASVTRLNASGAALDDGSDATAQDFVSMGTEGGRADHESHWPLWVAVNYTAQANGSVAAQPLYAGVVDWGRSYAFVSFTIDGARQVSTGWIYEDDESLVLTAQRGYQGAFSLFRDLYLKVIPNVDPSMTGLYEPGYWGVNNATSGSVTITTLGQRVVPETIAAYKKGSKVSNSPSLTLDKTGYTPLATQPTGRHYAVSGSFVFNVGSTAQAGFRVLASAQEFTDILYDPVAQNVSIYRTSSSLIASYGTQTEVGGLRLWQLVGSNTTTMNMTVYVDGSIVEVYANDELAITTRAYPWLSASVGCGVLSNGTGSSVAVSGLELWDGLVNAWPERPTNSFRGLLNDGPIASIYGLWAGN
ncbi:glycoside hydrolase family 32 protein [Athelia psychrophila]|uniref:Glycoside hydrolase family 32 protein n=1 Tax=Athelia psychrophila TaxID=1759441 RepID=A0A166R957_9AGAM|nr:glycoside hydrolase family 32 protein [Fibularhizoctonia sp. CBS 109695]